jgi:hypothetical protein
MFPVRGGVPYPQGRGLITDVSLNQRTNLEIQQLQLAERQQQILRDVQSIQLPMCPTAQGLRLEVEGCMFVNSQVMVSGFGSLPYVPSHSSLLMCLFLSLFFYTPSLRLPHGDAC